MLVLATGLEGVGSGGLCLKLDAIEACDLRPLLARLGIAREVFCRALCLGCLARACLAFAFACASCFCSFDILSHPCARYPRHCVGGCRRHKVRRERKEGIVCRCVRRCGQCARAPLRFSAIVHCVLRPRLSCALPAPVDGIPDEDKGTKQSELGLPDQGQVVWSQKLDLV